MPHGALLSCLRMFNCRKVLSRRPEFKSVQKQKAIQQHKLFPLETHQQIKLPLWIILQK